MYENVVSFFNSLCQHPDFVQINDVALQFKNKFIIIQLFILHSSSSLNNWPPVIQISCKRSALGIPRFYSMDLNVAGFAIRGLSTRLPIVVVRIYRNVQRIRTGQASRPTNRAKAAMDAKLRNAMLGLNSGRGCMTRSERSAPLSRVEFYRGHLDGHTRKR